MDPPPHGSLPDAPPPTYDSLANGEGNVESSETVTQDAELEGQNANGVAAEVDDEQCCSVGECMGYTCGVLLCMAIGLGLPIAEMYFGGFYFNECPAQRLLPIYLSVSGSVIVAALGGTGSKTKCDDEDSPNWCSRICLGIIYLFMFIWLICGSVWVFRMKDCDLIKKDEPGDCFTSSLLTLAVLRITDSTDYTYLYCNKTIYKATYWIIVVKWILICLALGIGLVVGVATKVSSCFKSDEPEEGEREGEPQTTQPAVILSSLNAIES